MAYITLSEEVDVTADDWFDEAYESERKEMYELCKEHFAAEEVLVRKRGSENVSIIENEFLSKLDELEKRYLSLTTEQINLIMSI